MSKTKIQPKKSLGQNFLTDENIVRKIISSLSLNSDDYVLEIGPGLGALTKYIIEDVNRLVAVEIDRNLVPKLREQFSANDNFIIHEADILKISFEDILQGLQGWKVAANLPYHITSPVLFKLFDNRRFFNSATMMIQKEVAQRMVAEPGSKTYGILSVFSQYYSNVTKLFDVSRHVFFPVPDVTSSVVQWQFKNDDILDKNQERLFRQIVKGVFAQRRKMLRNSLNSIVDLNIDITKLDVDLKLRPEQLSVNNFVDLTQQIDKLKTLKSEG